MEYLKVFKAECDDVFIKVGRVHSPIFIIIAVLTQKVFNHGIPYFTKKAQEIQVAACVLNWLKYDLQIITKIAYPFRITVYHWNAY